jgi:hypothetical protein
MSLPFFYNRKLGLAHAHFKRPEKTISCLPHAKFTVLAFLGLGTGDTTKYSHANFS